MFRQIRFELLLLFLLAMSALVTFQELDYLLRGEEQSAVALGIREVLGSRGGFKRNRFRGIDITYHYDNRGQTVVDTCLVPPERRHEFGVGSPLELEVVTGRWSHSRIKGTRDPSWFAIFGVLASLLVYRLVRYRLRRNGRKLFRPESMR